MRQCTVRQFFSDSMGSWGTDEVRLQRDRDAPSSRVEVALPLVHHHVRHSHRNRDNWGRSGD